MTTTEFTDLLKNPSQLSTMSYESLDKLLLQFPYCNSVRMLLLKKYKNDKHIAFERHLTLASMYAADRGKLYEFLNASIVSNAAISIDPNTTVVDSTKLSEEKKTKLATQLVAPPPVYHYKISDNPPVLAFQKPLTAEELSIGYPNSDNDSSVEDDRSLSNMPIEEWLQEFEPPRIDEKEKGLGYKKGFKLSRIPIFEKSMFDFLEEEEEEVEAIAIKKTSPKKGVSKKSKDAQKATAKMSDSEAELLKAEMNLFKEVLPNSKEELGNVDLEQDLVDEDDELVFKNLDKIYKETPKSIDVFDLFLSQTDGFLKSIHDKKETKNNAAFEEWEDDSIDENEDVASETLADILAKQGQKDKAIKMYETLSLNFPKKSRLFADKIAKLRK